MANTLPSFASGSNLVIYVDGVRLAYASNLSVSDDMSHAPVGGIGGYNMDANEPVQYAVRGAFSITHYDKNAFDRTKEASGGSAIVADRAAGQANGNSFLKSKYFSPFKLLSQRSFDIQVYERVSGGVLSATPMYVIGDCRLTSYGLTFTPGQLVAENMSFVALSLTDRVALANAPTA